MKLFRGRATKAASGAAAGTSQRADDGPVVVLVNDLRTHQDAIEWAAAEAAARQSELRVAYAFRWHRTDDGFGNPIVDVRARGEAERVALTAERLARHIVPSLRVTPYICPGKPSAIVADLVRHGGSESLLVVGRDHSSDRFVRWSTRHLFRQTTGAVAVIGLTGPEAIGPSSGRVVVGVDENGGPVTALAFAFRAARRRRTGLTIVHARTRKGGDIGEAARLLQLAYPEIHVRWRIVAGLAESAILAESASAALTVVGSGAPGRLSGFVRRSTADTVQRLARSPVVLVGTRS